MNSANSEKQSEEGKAEDEEEEEEEEEEVNSANSEKQSEEGKAELEEEDGRGGEERRAEDSAKVVHNTTHRGSGKRSFGEIILGVNNVFGNDPGARPQTRDLFKIRSNTSLPGCGSKD